MTTKVKSPLPESLMKAIKVTVESPDLTPVEKFEAVVLVTNGYGLFSQNETVDPSAYAIPAKQWGEISELLMTLADTDVSKVNIAMEWMNIGPSGYEE